MIGNIALRIWSVRKYLGSLAVNFPDALITTTQLPTAPPRSIRALRDRTRATKNGYRASSSSPVNSQIAYLEYISNRASIMSGKAGAYGTTGGGDTDFRKTWDREEMAKKAKERETKERDEAKERYEAKMAGKTYRRRASTPEDLKETVARTERIDWSKMIGKQTLTSAAAAVGKRGRGAGAYCQACDLTFK